MAGNHKLGLRDARMLLRMLEGETIPSSKFSNELAEQMLEDGCLTQICHKSFRQYCIEAPQACLHFLAQQYGIHTFLEKWISFKERTKGALTRAEQVTQMGDSKFKTFRSFRGFLCNVIEPIEVEFSGCKVMLNPNMGMAYFVEDFTHFTVPLDVVIVGVENGENFQQIERQKQLFNQMRVIFVSRYPQSSDLRAWLKMIPNRYLHFGDFDLAGIHIYLTEFFSDLGPRAEFFIPDDIEERLKNGNSALYDQQYLKFKSMHISDARVESLVTLIHRYRKGYEQEGYIV